MINYQRATIQDALALSEFAAKCFAENFGYLYHVSDLQSFLDSNYAHHIIAEEINTPDYYTYIAYAGNTIAGFVKAGPCKLPIENPTASAYEIHRLYVDNSYQGKGIGKQLLSDAIAWCEQQHAHNIYIGVWENNLRAQALYQNAGFHIIGEYGFKVGRHTDREFIMKRKITSP